MEERATSDWEPTVYEDEHGPVGIFLFDDGISSHVFVNAYNLVTNPPCHSNDDTKTLPKSSTVLRWSFGYSTETVSNILRSIPSYLNHKLNAICVALETVNHNSEVWMRNQTEQNTRSNVGYTMLCRNAQRQLVEDEENDRCAILRISIEGLSFNSMLLDLWDLVGVAQHTKVFGSGTAFPFETIDYLCIIVHDIEHSFEEATVRYCRVMLPNAAPPAAQLVCMLTRRKFESSGALQRVQLLPTSQ